MSSAGHEAVLQTDFDEENEELTTLESNLEKNKYSRLTQFIRTKMGYNNWRLQRQVVFLVALFSIPFMIAF